jgi:NADH:ubiquinone oxidoreductase subunit 3 (subunit A)
MSLLHDYAYVLGFLLIGVGFVVLNYFLPLLISPKSRGARSKSTYESGEVPIGSAWIQFDISYYLFALIFIAFDVEVAFLFPVLTVYREMMSFTVLFELALFLILLSFAIMYGWKKGLFEWR